VPDWRADQWSTGQEAARGAHQNQQEVRVVEPIELSMAQEFDIERLTRAIEAESDVGKLRQMAKMLLSAWVSQRAAAAWVIQQAGRR